MTPPARSLATQLPSYVYLALQQHCSSTQRAASSGISVGRFLMREVEPSAHLARALAMSTQGGLTI